ncbi:ABC transporter permease [Halorarum halophilum]|uniref:ABC transporter permease n=1 Tax=Halorarum halophilum TaxID=2743090 RepID=A0A7D5GBL4_9EURY|nr:ABC transporter permease [Halobaculum halophilum]QLG27592.1 ABC transporter permease [Halobaculum halophilum]
MSRLRRVRAEATASYRSFLRRKTAVFFTFFFPVILVVIFGALVRTRPGGGGLFAEPAAFYVPGYLATVVLFTPLSRVGSEIARHRDDNRFEKLATTPLTRAEWLLAHTAVNVAIIGAASALILALTLLLTGATIPVTPALALLVPLVVLGVVLFCGFGAVLGRLADSQDGVIAASNTIALPLLFLSDTFVTTDLLPGWFAPVVNLSPLTYFARGVRGVTYAVDGSLYVPPLGVVGNLAVLAVLAAAFFVAGAYAIPRTD